VILEGMSCGAVVVASKVGGIPEILTGSLESMLFPRGDDRALAGILTRLAGDKAFYGRMQELGRPHVINSFSLERMANGIEESLHLGRAAYERRRASRRNRSS
jgi:glycosyltransferase involved in cell wall biosynthesis